MSKITWLGFKTRSTMLFTLYVDNDSTLAHHRRLIATSQCTPAQRLTLYKGLLLKCNWTQNAQDWEDIRKAQKDGKIDWCEVQEHWDSVREEEGIPG